MDQAEPADQAFLRNVGERGEDPNLDSGVGLRAGGDHQTGLAARSFPLHFSTDFVRPPLRKNRAFVGLPRP